MKDHTDSAKPAALSRKITVPASAKEEKLARALKRNLQRRKQAMTRSAGAGA